MHYLLQLQKLICRKVLTLSRFLDFGIWIRLVISALCRLVRHIILFVRTFRIFLFLFRLFVCNFTFRQWRWVGVVVNGFFRLLTMFLIATAGRWGYFWTLLFSCQTDILWADEQGLAALYKHQQQNTVSHIVQHKGSRQKYLHRHWFRTTRQNLWPSCVCPSYWYSQEDSVITNNRLVNNNTRLKLINYGLGHNDKSFME